MGAARVELLDSYIRILGRHTALAAVASNEQMLLQTTTPAAVEESFGELSRLVGVSLARRICVREPSVLYMKPDGVRDSIAALEETIGAEAACFAVERNPTLLQPGRAAHVRQALAALAHALGGDVALARELAQRNTMLLGTPASTIVGAADALGALFGGLEAARALASRHPGLLRSLPRTLHGAHSALVDILGGAERAAAAVRVNRSLLRARPVTLLSAWAALRSAFGEAAARELVWRQLGVLRSRAITITSAYDLLVSALGAERGRSAALATPALLQIRTVALEYNWRHFAAFLGEARAADVVSAVPHVLMMRLGRASVLTDALTRIYGTQQAAGEWAPVPAYRKGGEQLLQRFEALIAIYGDERAARRAVQTDPVLLTTGADVLRVRVRGVEGGGLAPQLAGAALEEAAAPAARRRGRPPRSI